MTARWDDPDVVVIMRALMQSPAYPSLLAMMYVRASQWSWNRGWRLVAHLLKARAIRIAGIEVHPASVIGPGFAFLHGVGIVVGHEVVAGRDLVLYQGVTLGHGAEGPASLDSVTEYAWAPEPRFSALSPSATAHASVPTPLSSRTYTPARQLSGSGRVTDPHRPHRPRQGARVDQRRAMAA